MGVTSTAGFNFTLVANGITLDLFKDETFTISDNATGLFDVGTLPTEFTRTITLPGSKKNNEFFEQYYDISVENPFLFATNTKVDAYFDFGGIYLASGYLQLNKVNVVANKYIDSYEVNIFGSLASFAREVNRAFLTDIDNLTQYDHTSSVENISGSWNNNLFNGDIKYPLADYGKDYFMGSLETFGRNGINTNAGYLKSHDFKPGIRVVKVLDAIFDKYGYTYESDFLTSSFFDDMYLLLHNGGKYITVDGLDLETIGQIRVAATSGSSSDIVLDNDEWTAIKFQNNEYDPSGYYTDAYSYKQSLGKPSDLRGKFKFKLNVSGSAGVPQLNFGLAETGSYDAYKANPTASLDGLPGNRADINSLETINKYLRQEYTVTQGNADQDYEFEYQWVTDAAVINGGGGWQVSNGREYYFVVQNATYGGSNYTAVLAPNGDIDSFIEVNEMTEAGEWSVVEIQDNMPTGTAGIKQIDFIRALQKKFNLIIYPSKTKPKHFVIETFNNWYKKGKVKNFNKFINLDSKIEVTPANNLAVNKLEFGGILDNDLLSQNFNKQNNREYGKSFYIDTQNFFSQGEFKVESTDAASPLRYVVGTGITGSANVQTGYSILYFRTTSYYGYDVCSTSIRTGYITSNRNYFDVGDIVYTDSTLTTRLTGYRFVMDTYNDIWYINSSTGVITGYFANCVDEPTS